MRLDHFEEDASVGSPSLDTFSMAWTAALLTKLTILLCADHPPTWGYVVQEFARVSDPVPLRLTQAPGVKSESTLAVKHREIGIKGASIRSERNPAILKRRSFYVPDKP